MPSLKVGELYQEIRLDDTKFRTGLAESHERVKGFGSSLTGMATGVAAGLGVYGALSGAFNLVKGAIGDTISSGIAYGDQMNVLRAVTSATASQMDAFGKRAIELGNDLSLPNTSASDAARAMTELAKAGISVNDTMAAAKGVLELSAAATIDEGKAATYVAQALNAFHMEGTRATEVADLLAAAANASAAEVTDIGDAMQMSAAVFSAAHVPLHDLVTMIGELANNGIRGSDAGTSLKQAMLQLQTPSKQQTTLLKEMNLSLYDSNGKMRDMRSIIGDLLKGTKGMTDQQRDYALGVIFGSDAIRVANILLHEGVAGFDAMSAATGKQGAAADLAAAKSKGLGGALRGLQSEVETLELNIYNTFEPALESVVRMFSDRLPGAIASAGGVLSGWQRGIDDFARSTGLKSLLDDINFIWKETHAAPPQAARGPAVADVKGPVAAPQMQAPQGMEEFGRLLAGRLGDSIGAAAPRIGDAVSSSLMKAVGGVDWFALGEQAAPAAYGFLVGFMGQWMDPRNMANAIRKHPVEGLLTITSLATMIFGPEEMIGVKLAGWFGKVPIVGPILEGLTKTLNKAGTPGRAVGEFLGSNLVKGIAQGLGKDEVVVMDGLKMIGLRMVDALDWLRTALYTLGSDIMQAIGRGIGAAVDIHVLTPVRVITRQADEILSYLILRGEQIGSEALSGLGRGAQSAWEPVAGWFGGVASRVSAAVGDLGSTLWGAGNSLMQGFLNGLKSKWGEVTGFVGGIKSWVEEHKGPIEDDRRLLIPHGHATMAGFHEGLLRGWGQVQGTLGTFKASLGGFGPSNSLALAGAAAGGAVAPTMQASAASRPQPSAPVQIVQNFYGNWPSDHRQMLADAAWDARQRR